MERSDICLKPGTIVAEGDFVIAHGRFSGFGAPVNWIAADIVRIKDGVLAPYGGAVITEAGNHAKVSALVYIAAFAPDKGESVGSLIKDPPPGAPVPPILPPQDGFLFLDKAKFPASFAADVDLEKAAFMADSQVPWGMGAISGAISEPAWRTKQSWYLVTTEDKMIPPDAQRAMSKRAGATVVEVQGSHAIYVSQPRAVADLIEQAATKVKAATA